MQLVQKTSNFRLLYAPKDNVYNNIVAYVEKYKVTHNSRLPILSQKVCLISSKKGPTLACQP